MVSVFAINGSTLPSVIEPVTLKTIVSLPVPAAHPLIVASVLEHSTIEWFQGKER
jgi:hypothetical protein